MKSSAKREPGSSSLSSLQENQVAFVTVEINHTVPGSHLVTVCEINPISRVEVGRRGNRSLLPPMDNTQGSNLVQDLDLRKSS